MKSQLKINTEVCGLSMCLCFEQIYNLFRIIYKFAGTQKLLGARNGVFKGLAKKGPKLMAQKLKGCKN